MDVKIENSDIALTESGNTIYINGIDEIVQRVKIACSTKKGAFAPDRSLGSYAHTIDINSDMLCENLTMLFKEATISVCYDDLKVTNVDVKNSPVVAEVEIKYAGKTAYTEVSIDV